MTPLLVALAAAATALGGLAWLRAQDRGLRRRLQRVAAPLSGRAAAATPAPEETIFRQTRRRSRLSGLWRLIEARFPLIDAPRALPQALAAGLLGGAGFWLAMSVLGMSGPWTTPAAAAAGAGAAWYALGRLQARQESAFVREFPEIVDQIVRLSGAGLPPLEAISAVVEDAPAPVGPVLREVSDALLAGLDPDTALRQIARRLRLAEFTMFAAVIRLQRRAGGGVTAAFSNLAATLRERRATALKAKASTAQTRLTLVVLMLMPPVVLAVQSVTQPESIDILFNTEDGQTLLRVGIALVAAGLLVAKQIGARGES